MQAAPCHCPLVDRIPGLSPSSSLLPTDLNHFSRGHIAIYTSRFTTSAQSLHTFLDSTVLDRNSPDHPPFISVPTNATTLLAGISPPLPFSSFNYPLPAFCRLPAQPFGLGNLPTSLPCLMSRYFNSININPSRSPGPSQSTIQPASPKIPSSPAKSTSRIPPETHGSSEDLRTPLRTRIFRIFSEAFPPSRSANT